MTDPDTGRAAMRDGLAIRQLSGEIYHDYVSIAIDKKDSSDPLPLVQRVTEIVKAMHQDGTLRKFSQQYYQGDFTAPAAGFDIQALKQLP